MVTYHKAFTAWGTPKAVLLPSASDIRARMAERTARLSERVRAARPVVVQVERTQVVVCCGMQGGGMRATKFSIRAGRRVGRC